MGRDVRLLCCGPRNIDTHALPLMRVALREVLRASFPFAPGFVLAHGAARGADMLWEEALAWVYEREPALWMPVRRMPAKWSKEGKAAGPLRNQRMLEQVAPTYWLAAHWSEEPDTPGTADMVRRLMAAEVSGRVVVVPRPEPKRRTT
jgi:hypothetical protein